MLNEPATEEGSVTPAATEGIAATEGGTEAGSGVSYIRVTPQEKESIERVCVLSFFLTRYLLLSVCCAVFLFV